LYENGQVVLAAALALEEDPVSKKKKYVVSTLLEPSWAYNNARLLSNIESSWLNSKLAEEEIRDNDSDSDRGERSQKQLWRLLR
jgi:hypothetical protein